MTSVYLVFEIEYENNDFDSFEIPMLDSDYTKTFLTLNDAEDYIAQMQVNEMPRLLELAKKWEFKKTTFDELNDRFGVAHALEIKELIIG